MRPLGRLVRLQVQVARLKRGDGADRWYDADRIRRVGALELTDRGVVGLDGDERIVDNHHVDHPDSRFRGDNGISLGLTGHYAALRERFGEVAAVGVAGENLVVDLDGVHGADDLAVGLTIRGEDEAVLLAPTPIEPCVEFSRYLVGRAAALREPLQALRGGMRGFKLALASDPGVVVREGDEVWLGTP